MQSKLFRDQFGNYIQAPGRYAVGPKRSGGVPCELYFDFETDEMMLRRCHGAPNPQRLDEVDRAAHFTAIDEDDVELENDPSETSSEAFLDQQLGKARAIKDQLEAISDCLIAHFHAEDDPMLIDEIRLCVFGDGRRDVVLDLAPKKTTAA